MHRPAIDIYSGTLVDITTSCLEDLRQVFRSEGRIYIYAANGHGAWEAAFVNVLSRGDKILVLENGLFAAAWGDMAAVLGLEVETLPGSWRRAVDPAALEARLREDRRAEIKAILVVQVDTASGSVNDVPAIRRAIDATDHDALLMVDTIASLATMPFEMDGWGVDVAVAGSQKGLMMPPGLSFVAAGGKALAPIARLGFERNTGTGRRERASCTIRNIAKPRPSTCCSGSARRFQRHRLWRERRAAPSACVGRGRGIRFQCPRTVRTRRFGDNRENA